MELPAFEQLIFNFLIPYIAPAFIVVVVVNYVKQHRDPGKPPRKKLYFWLPFFLCTIISVAYCASMAMPWRQYIFAPFATFGASQVYYQLQKKKKVNP